MAFFKKKEQPTVQQPVEKSIEDLDLELQRLQLLKQQKELQNAAAKEKPSEKTEDVEKLYIKTLSDVEAIVRLCEEKRWLTKKDWDANNVPMKQLVTELLKVTIKHSGCKVEELIQLMKEMKMDSK